MLEHCAGVLGRAAYTAQSPVSEARTNHLRIGGAITVAPRGGAEHCCASYALWCCAHTSYCANSKAPVRGLIVGAMMRDMYISARYRGAYSILALVWH